MLKINVQMKLELFFYWSLIDSQLGFMEDWLCMYIVTVAGLLYARRWQNTHSREKDYQDDEILYL